MEGGPSIQAYSAHSGNHSDEHDPDIVIINETCCFSFCNPRGKGHRFLPLIFMCWLTFGAYFCFDNPSALQNYMVQDLNMTATEFSLMYTLYSWPPVVTCLIGGVLIDRYFGVSLGSNIYISITLIGHIIFAGGALLNKFWIMALGRFIFGIGSEPSSIAQNNYAVAWFKGKELNMVFGLQQSCTSLGTVINFLVMDPLYTSMSKFFAGHQLLGVVLLIAGITCVFSLLCSILLGIIHKTAAREIGRIDTNAEGIITIRGFFKFHWSLWVLNVICVTYYIAIYPFYSFSKAFLMTKFNMTSTEANNLNSFQNFVCVLAAPLLGFMVDKIGRNASWVILAVLSAIVAHAIVGFLPLSPYIGMTLLSLSASLISSSLWPMITFVIPDHHWGTAYGFSYSVQNLFIGLATLLVGVIIDHAEYIWLEVFFLTCLIVSLIGTILLLILNSAQNGTLNMTPSEREIHSAAALERQHLLGSSEERT